MNKDKENEYIKSERYKQKVKWSPKGVGGVVRVDNSLEHLLGQHYVSRVIIYNLAHGDGGWDVEFEGSAVGVKHTNCCIS